MAATLSFKLDPCRKCYPFFSTHLNKDTATTMKRMYWDKSGVQSYMPNI